MFLFTLKHLFATIVIQKMLFVKQIFRFFDTLRKASDAPKVIFVTAWRDLETLVRVKIEH